MQSTKHAVVLSHESCVSIRSHRTSRWRQNNVAIHFVRARPKLIIKSRLKLTSTLHHPLKRHCRTENQIAHWLVLTGVWLTGRHHSNATWNCSVCKI